MFVLKIHNKPLLRRQQLQGVFVHRETGSKRGGGGASTAPWTITWSCVFLNHNLKLSPNRALLKWCFPKVATLRWRLLLRPLYNVQDWEVKSATGGGGGCPIHCALFGQYSTVRVRKGVILQPVSALLAFLCPFPFFFSGSRLNGKFKIAEGTVRSCALLSGLCNSI